MLISENNLSVRVAEENDFNNMVDYFLKADNQFLQGMGVDPEKLPKRGEWLTLLLDDHKKDIENKGFYYIIWLLENMPVGHSNINKIIFGKEAYMHLHFWRSDKRQKGFGFEFMKLCIPYYFNSFKLKKIYCEPYALNPGPNKILKKLGFDFIKQYETTPGRINFYQPVNRWCLDIDIYKLLFKDMNLGSF